MGVGRRQMCFLCISSVWIVRLKSALKLLSKQNKQINSRCSRCPCKSICNTIFVNKFSWYSQLQTACVSRDVWVFSVHMCAIIASKTLYQCVCIWLCVQENPLNLGWLFLCSCTHIPLYILIDAQQIICATSKKFKLTNVLVSVQFNKCVSTKLVKSRNKVLDKVILHHIWEGNTVFLHSPDNYCYMKTKILHKTYEQLMKYDPVIISSTSEKTPSANVNSETILLISRLRMNFHAALQKLLKVCSTSISKMILTH